MTKLCVYLDGVEGRDHQSSIQAAKKGDERRGEEKQRHRQQHPAVRHIFSKHLTMTFRGNGQENKKRLHSECVYLYVNFTYDH